MLPGTFSNLVSYKKKRQGKEVIVAAFRFVVNFYPSSVTVL